MKKFLFLLMFFSLILSQPGFSAGKMLTMASDPWPPFIDSSEPGGGLSLEIIRAAYKTQGYEVKMENVPWARAEEGVKMGTYDILPNTWVTEERKAYLMYSDPFAANEVRFIKKKYDPFEYSDLSSLKGKRIGIIRGYGYGDAFMASTEFKRETTSNFMLNVKKLVAGRLDLIIEDEIVARAKINKKNPAILNKLEFTKKPFSRKDVHVTCGLENPRHKEIISAFNKGLMEIKKNGDYATIMTKYGIDH